MQRSLSLNLSSVNQYAGAGAPRRNSSLPKDFDRQIQGAKNPHAERAVLMQTIHSAESKDTRSDSQEDRACLVGTVSDIPSKETLVGDSASAVEALGKLLGFEYSASRAQLCAECVQQAKALEESRQDSEHVFTDKDLSPAEVAFYELCEVVQSDATPEKKLDDISQTIASWLEAYGQQQDSWEVPNTTDHQGIAEMLALQEHLLDGQNLDAKQRSASLGGGLLPLSATPSHTNPLVDFE